MPYFSNKPAPTPPNLLPTPKLPGAAIIKDDEKAKKRKLAGIAEAKNGESKNRLNTNRLTRLNMVQNMLGYHFSLFEFVK